VDEIGFGVEQESGVDCAEPDYPVGVCLACLKLRRFALPDR